MSIDRHNYEEYFILYMDNELSPPERRKLEAFVQQHPDLKEELDGLLQYKLVPDTDVFFDRKEELMSPFAENKNSLVTGTNYTDWLILYIDNELVPAERNAVESFVAANDFAKKELELLSRTKLPQEEIVFSDKASLYRHEKLTRHITFRRPRLQQAFGGRRWRVAAAAVLLLGISITTAILVNKKSPEEGIAKESPSSKKQEAPLVKEGINPVTDNNETGKEIINPVERNNSIKPAPRNLAVNTPLKTKEVIKNQVPDEKPLKQTNAVAINENKQNNNLPQPLKNPYINNNTQAIADNSNSPRINKEKQDLTKSPVTSDETPPLDLVQASFPGNDEDLDQPEKKNKLRGIFRKLTRTLEKRTNIDATDDGNNLLVAGLSFKLK